MLKKLRIMNYDLRTKECFQHFKLFTAFSKILSMILDFLWAKSEFYSVEKIKNYKVCAGPQRISQTLKVSSAFSKILFMIFDFYCNLYLYPMLSFLVLKTLRLLNSSLGPKDFCQNFNPPLLLAKSFFCDF